MSTVKFAVPDEDPEFASRIANLIKINVLLSQTNGLLQTMFKERWGKYFGSAWDDDPPGNAAEFINGIGQRMFRGAGKIQKGAMESGNVDKWDITMLTDILMYVDFDGTPDKNERTYLELLKQVRNKVAHSPQAGIADLELETLWSNAEKVLLYFGWNREEIHKLKNSTNVAEFDNQNTSAVKVESSQLAMELKIEGNQLHKEQQFGKAIEAYTTAIALDGLSRVDCGVLYSNRSVSYLRLADELKEGKKHGINGNVNSESARQRAIDDAKEATRLRPAWYKGYFRAGSAYHADRKYEKALRSFDWALSLAPANEEIQAARYESRRKLGIDTRNEHMDPLQMRKNGDIKKVVEERLGRKISSNALDMARKFNEKRIPGQADVYKGHDYRDGTSGMKQDDEAALRSYTKAAAAENAEGIYNLAQMYKAGRGVQQNFAMAIKLFKEAASKPAFRNDTREPVVGVAEAEHALGLAYDEGVGVPQNDTEAYKWYKKSSDHGCSNASNNLAFMHKDGKGVPEDVKRASQFWHLSATQGNPLAMESLAIYYINVECDPVQAHHWHELAIANGNLHAKLTKKEFDEAVNRLGKDLKKTEKTVTEWETKQGLKADGLKLIERQRRMLEGISPEGMQMMDDMKRLFVTGEAMSKTPWATAKLTDLTMLSKYAARGSITARDAMTASKYFYAALRIYNLGLDSNTWPKFCADLAECCRHDYKVIKYTPALSTALYDYVKTLPEDVTSDLDKNARVCCSFVNSFGNDLTSSLRFAEACKKKYPEEILFHRLTSDCFSFSKDYKSGLKAAKESLKLFPGDVDLLYNVAAVGFLMFDGNSIAKEIIQAYQDFLDAAPKDHRKVPQSYYAMGVVCMSKDVVGVAGNGKAKKMSKNSKHTGLNLDEAKKYYQLGLDAEKVQLPCYLPYESTHKPMLENLIRMVSMAAGAGAVPRAPPQLNSSQSGATGADTKRVSVGVADDETRRTILTSPLRIKVIKEHREFIKEWLKQEKEMKSGPPQRSFTTEPPRHKQSAPARLTGLKPITFKEMNMFKDQVYEDCVLAVRSIEDLGDLHRPSIKLVLEDENGAVCRALVYNFGAIDRKSVVEQLGYGSKLSIINPYMRLAVDGGYGIRVDDRGTLFLHSGNTPTACRFCGKEDAKLTCGKCKRAFYCNRECQEIDWKKFQHKLICDPALA